MVNKILSISSINFELVLLPFNYLLLFIKFFNPYPYLHLQEECNYYRF